MARKIGSRYVAHKVLGRGACGSVWQGEGPDGPVAIKLLREDLAADQDVVNRFIQERTALTSLEHPNIVGIRELVVDGVDVALVMDLVRGHDLRDRLERDKVLTPQDAVAIAADVAEALAVAHAEGIIHRDVKPENVLLDDVDGQARARLTDFGIARLVDSPRRTRATRIIGTPDYLAPEIIEGCQPTSAVDLYALGTVLFELLTGWTPFGGGHPGAVLRRHVTEAVPGIPGLPDSLARVLATCLSKAPASRPAAREMATCLRELVPTLLGLPPFQIPDPAAAEGANVEALLRAAPQGARSVAGVVPLVAAAGVVPLVATAGPDSSRDTHMNLKRPSLADLLPDATRPGTANPAAPGVAPGTKVPRQSRRARKTRTPDGAGKPGAPVLGGPRPPGSGETPRRRRAALAAVAAVAVVAGGAGAYVRLVGHEGTVSPASAADGASAQSFQLLSWSHWTSLPLAPVYLDGAPRPVVAGPRTYVFSHVIDGSVWFVGDEGGRFGGWQRLGGLRTAATPAVVPLTDGRLDVLAVGADDGSLYSFTMGANQDAWQRVDDRVRLQGSPAAVSMGAGRTAVIARSAAGALVFGTLSDGVWSGWQEVRSAGRVDESPALVARPGDLLDAFVVRDGVVLHIPFAQGVWRDAQSVGIAASGRPEAAFSGASGLQVFARSGSGGLVSAVLADGRWRGRLLSTVPADTVSPPGAAVDGSGRVDLYTRTGSMRVQYSAGHSE